MSEGSNVYALNIPEPEIYVTAKQLAEMMGVSESSVWRMKDEGMPYETWGRRLVRFRPTVAMQWARER